MCMGGGGGGGAKETGDQKELARIGMAQFDAYESMYKDVENDFFADVGKMNSRPAIQRTGDFASTNAASSFSDGTNDSVRQMTSSGFNPSSGGFREGITDISRGEGESRFDTTSRSQQALQDSYLKSKSNIVAMGQGQETQAIKGFGDIAQASSRSAVNDAYDNYEQFSSRRSAIATGVGAGAGMAYGNGPESEKPNAR